MGTLNVAEPAFRDEQFYRLCRGTPHFLSGEKILVCQLRIQEGSKILNPLTLLAGWYAREEMINYNTYVRKLNMQ